MSSFALMGDRPPSYAARELRPTVQSGRFRVSARHLQGVPVFLLRTGSLPDPAWNVVTGAVSPAGDLFLADREPLSTQRFYLLRVPPFPGGL